MDKLKACCFVVENTAPPFFEFEIPSLDENAPEVKSDNILEYYIGNDSAMK